MNKFIKKVDLPILSFIITLIGSIIESYFVTAGPYIAYIFSDIYWLQYFLLDYVVILVAIGFTLKFKKLVTILLPIFLLYSYKYGQYFINLNTYFTIDNASIDYKFWVVYIGQLLLLVGVLIIDYVSIKQIIKLITEKPSEK